MRGAKLVSKRSLSALSTGLFACACDAGGGNGLGSLPHFRPARRDEVVHPAHTGIDHPDADLDETKTLQCNIGGLTINEPCAKNTEQAQADEQHGKRNGGKAKCLLDDWHVHSDVLFRSKHGYRLTSGRLDYPVFFCERIPHNLLGVSFVPIIWLIYSKNAPELDSINQAKENKTLVLCSAVDRMPVLCTNFTRHCVVGPTPVMWVIAQ